LSFEESECKPLALGGAATVALHGLRVAARQSARTGPLMLLGLAVMTPLFQTMTAAISDDTAVATAVCSLAGAYTRSLFSSN
jgi:hypothetical protein